MDNRMTKIGFIGLGHMGNPMARCLLKAGFTVYVYDVLPNAADALISLGAIRLSSPKDMVQTVNVMITMVQTGQQVKDICLGLQGIFAHAPEHLLYIDSSSIDIETTLLLHQEANKAGIAMLDAPVSGGVAGAEQGSLTIMVGGEEKDFQRAIPIFKAMGEKISLTGTASHGQAAKLCNNLILGITMVGVCEAFCLAAKLGLDQKKFFDIAAHSSGQCWSMTQYCPVPDIIENVPSNVGYQPGFKAKMMLKDLHLGQQAAENVNAVIPLGAIATELYELYVSQGGGELDFSGIIQMLAGKT
jgi:3-hydroxyisobutyrate dehydrogenase